MNADTVNKINKIQNQQNKACTNKIKATLDKVNQSIDVNKY